ncbi:4Fe-4S dicluster domain-containing protein [Candidatus Borkfalkia ceftriaxoniphila]|uniref:4Fe-4S dicluster domain-containing protein n=1 Tax=Candidatus Borkfalkia ceftriaxoniphila TaxID=2508949 RepID=A0A4Q2KBH0_9FIRM|nr:[Fe-Fe] hydrogenase large subunit C-terminal domain-containing protein [Candidatus Borkfalkia ceftriaxoniphila]RXZ61925.1 4Fe-4S dicluster domain-containing protein [Candidatus Borkfalkia ceftriaxoniphila]
MVTLKTVVLDDEKCIGCITCMRRCPTEAIRIVNGKAKIQYEKCINCGECIRSCKGGAKRPVYDSFDLVKSYPYKIALPSPSLFGQFNHLDDPNYVIEGLLALGFDEVFEVGLAAELVTDCSKKLMAEGKLPRPVISTACPAVVELILMKFHELADHMLEVYAPAKIAAKLAKKRAIGRGIPADDIGIFFISPCPAKVYSLHKEEVSNEKYISGVLSQSDVYFRLVEKMNKIEKPRKLGKCGHFGINWGSSGGESNGLGLGNYIHCSGIRNVLGLLTEMSDGKLDGADFVEMNVCPGGCVGGVLNVENPFIARNKMRQLAEKMKTPPATMEEFGLTTDFFLWDKEPEPITSFRFDSDVFAAMEKMMLVEEYLKKLPGIDCGACGAPSCRTHAEDVAMSGGILNCVKLNEVK